MMVLWKAEAWDEFNPSKGIHSRNPLSPYLFVLYIEKLFQLVSLSLNQGTWKHIRLTRHGSPISHLAFADDLLLFAEASLE